jgi:Family of unknown function (DUF5767)
MQNFVENMGGSDIQISSNIGSVIELGDEDLGNDFGASMLSNTRVTSRPATQGSSQTVSALEPLQDIGIGGSLEPLEAISFDIPSSSSPAFPEISINKSSDDSSNLFSNTQTASGPSINLAAVSRLSPEEERKKKTELINKLNRLEAKNYTLTKRFTMDNSLDEIQQEYDRLVDAKNLEASLRFQRQCLMGVVTGAEFLNSKFNPFDWELDGWSESVHENIEDFDEIFEELYDKYRSRGNMPPEAKLLMSLVGSGFMFHMSNSFFRSKMANMDPSDIFRNNPQLAKQFAAAAAQQAGPGFGNFMGAAMGVPQGMPQMQPMAQQMPAGMGTGPFNQSSNGMGAPPMQSPQNMAAYNAPPPQRREMKGPSGVDDILKTFQEVRNAELEISPISIPPSEPSYYQQPARQAAVEIASIHNTPVSDVGSDMTRTGSTGQRASRGKRKPQAPTGNTMTLNL